MKYLIILLFFNISFGIGQTIQLNEIVSSNGDNLYDEDGDTPDWIEIYNPGPEVLNLSGFGLSDDTEDFHKWIFPDMNINPNDFIVVLASEKNRTDIINDWDNFDETEQVGIREISQNLIKQNKNWMKESSEISSKEFRNFAKTILSKVGYEK